MRGFHCICHRLVSFSSVDDIDIGLSNLRLFNLVTPNCCQSLTWPVSFDSIPEKTFAEQLTYMDAVSLVLLDAYFCCHLTLDSFSDHIVSMYSHKLCFRIP